MVEAGEKSIDPQNSIATSDVDMRNHRGPSEVVAKLVFPYLDWKELIRTGELVCKDWRNSLVGGDDVVWRPVCDGVVDDYEKRLVHFRRHYADHDGEFCGARHELLVTLMGLRAEHGRSCREILVLSERMGHLIIEHELQGPDVGRGRGEDTRTLRETCVRDYTRFVAPTIDLLKSVFDDPRKKDRVDEISEVKGRLVTHMRSKTALGRVRPRDEERTDLMAKAGEYVLSAATMASKSCGDDAFVPSSEIRGSIGDIVHAAEYNMGGKEVEAQLAVRWKKTPTGYEKQFFIHEPSGDAEASEGQLAPVQVQLKRTSGGFERKVSLDQPNTKRLRRSVLDMDWPMSPVDCLSFLIFKLWPSELDFIGEMDQEARWTNTIRSWWSSLGEQFRGVLVSIYRDLASRDDEMKPIPEDCDTTHVPFEALKNIVEFRFHFFRGKMADIVWRNLEPTLRNSIFEVYAQRSSSFADMIREEYKTVYGGADPETMAQLLLDIFLEVKPNNHYTRLPKMTNEYCSNVVETMERAMDRWDELIGLVKRGDGIIWNPETMSELMLIENRFGADSLKGRHPAQEFCPGFMVKRCLYELLSSEGTMPDFYTLKEKVKKVVKAIEQMANEDGTLIESDATLDMKQVLEEYRVYSSHFHAREHAMMAMIPLLPNLSAYDSRRLIYACFVEKSTADTRVAAWGFSEIHFKDFNTRGLPCHTNGVNDFTNLSRWTCGTNLHRCNQHEVTVRLFGLPLPANIISAMCSFFVERLYQRSLRDIDPVLNNAFEVIPFLERFTINNPGKASLVWDCYEDALRNAVNVVNVNDMDWGDSEAATFRLVVAKIMRSCIRTRAKKVIPVIRSLYETMPEGLEPPVPLETAIEMINEAPRRFVDCMDYHAEHARYDNEFV